MSEPLDARSCQIHVDPLSGRSVFVAPARAQCPREEALDVCPFCAGNEHLTPDEVLRSPADRALPWGARLIPNRYPIVVDHRFSPMPATPGAPAAGHRPAHGVHDVIVESPRHDRSILTVEAPHWRASWELARQRLEQLALRDDLVWGGLFKNSGRAAGASLDHVHSQLVALDFVPPPIVAQLAAGGGDRDPFTRIIAVAEREQRVVATSADLVALVSPAPRQPLETWLVPRRPGPWFHDAGPSVVAGLADLVREIVARIERAAPGADFNWWLHQAPFRASSGPEPEAGRRPWEGGVPPGWRWHLEILPRISPLAGFELGIGCHISTLSPEASARRLRGV